MLYTLAHIIRDKMPVIWIAIDYINSFLFNLRYGKKLQEFCFTAIPHGYKVLRLNEIDTKEIVDFFNRQPEEAFKYFKPHAFDYETIKSLQQNKAFLAYLILDETKDDASCSSAIAGYCFNRSFFHGKGFRGRLVDINYRGKGLGTALNRLLNEVGFSLGLQLFETVSTDNLASYRSALRASRIKILHENKGTHELYIEILNEPISDIKSMDKKFRGGKYTLTHYYSGSFNIERAA
ncbi:MAG: GNAT family N-acetyltransferase [Muribaculaceae bacterium]